MDITNNNIQLSKEEIKKQKLKEAKQRYYIKNKEEISKKNKERFNNPEYKEKYNTRQREKAREQRKQNDFMLLVDLKHKYLSDDLGNLTLNDKYKKLNEIYTN
jgi:hypothetical protein